MKEKLKKEKERKIKQKISHHTSQNSGITLVALIITIIVLLILAVVAIRAVQGDGIIQHAKNARDNYNQAQIEENGTLQNYADYITGQLGGSAGGESSVDHTTEDGVPIPKGFTQVEGTTKATGLVITDGTSEFVWIPVTELNTSGFNEPEVVTGSGSVYDADEENLKRVLEGEYASQKTAENFKNQLTAEFNSMKTSVNKYHGFYVGRYETSLNGTTAQSKAGETPMNNIDWYAMYTNSKKYAPENSSKAVVSQMIWGSQWNAMIDYIKTTADASHAEATDNAPHNLSDPYETGGKNLDESIGYNDKAANIYDLEGNVAEWTQEAHCADDRVGRGGICCSIAFSPSDRFELGCPDESYSTNGSRLALYIK